MPAVIFHSVGEGGKNNPSDVLIIQGLLNQVPYAIGGPAVKLNATGIIDQATKYAIGNFQDYWFKWSDGRVDPFGVTLSFLDLKARPLADSLPFLPTQPRYVPQVKDNRCWAAVGTMMHNWKHGTAFTMDQFYAALLNNDFKEYYDGDVPMPAHRIREYVTTKLRMKGLKLAELPTPSVGMWLDTLKAYQVVVVQHMVKSGGTPYLHARILSGMSGMGEPDSTSIRVIDPSWDGLPQPVYPMYHAKMIPYTQFADEFAAAADPSTLRVWHY